MEYHGRGYEDKTYCAWKGMKTRCYVKSAYAYRWYGARGIIVCDRWKNSFINFLKDMGDCPDGFSLDRIDCDGNYEPRNCRWIILKEQHRNTRRCRLISALGKTMLLTDWAKDLSMYHGEISQLISHGWTIEEIIVAKTNPEFKRKKFREIRFRLVCKRGHKKEGGNLYINSRGSKLCRICANDSTRRSAQKKKLPMSSLDTLEHAGAGILMVTP